ncbi:MAG: hypothetical protein KIS79_03510 [Burkholderiales bacterium]|nr:hypothetical protein [Burkholderiales bacterium]
MFPCICYIDQYHVPTSKLFDEVAMQRKLTRHFVTHARQLRLQSFDFFSLLGYEPGAARLDFSIRRQQRKMLVEVYEIHWNRG